MRVGAGVGVVLGEGEPRLILLLTFLHPELTGEVCEAG